MKKLACFVCLSAVSGLQLSFGSGELPINNKYVARLSGQEPTAYVLLFFSFCSMVCVCQGFLNFIPFDLIDHKMQISWGQGQMITSFKPFFSTTFHLFLTISSLTLVFKARSY